VLVDAGALVGLVLGALLAGRRLGLRCRVPRVIDLRTITLDGEGGVEGLGGAGGHARPAVR
jgi:hypothetical protein